MKRCDTRIACEQQEKNWVAERPLERLGSYRDDACKAIKQPATSVGIAHPRHPCIRWRSSMPRPTVLHDHYYFGQDIIRGVRGRRGKGKGGRGTVEEKPLVTFRWGRAETKQPPELESESEKRGEEKGGRGLPRGAVLGSFAAKRCSERTDSLLAIGQELPR